MMQQLRDAIETDGRSQNRLAKAAGLDNSRLSRFVRGERDLTFEAAARLCDVLGIAFTPPRRPADRPAEAEPTPAPTPRRRPAVKKSTMRKK